MFRAYPRIDRALEWDPKDDVEYVVTEKIDGANLSFWVNTNFTVTVARRHGPILPDENFFRLHEAPWLEDIKQSLKGIRLYFPPGEDVVVYGELYGPGVQNRVHYGPDLAFAAFDIATVRDGEIQFMDFPMAMKMCTALGVPTVPVLATLPRAEALAYSPVFKSIVFPDAPEGNFAEGVVVRPIVEPEGGRRNMVKLKHPRFDSAPAANYHNWHAEALARINAPRFAEARSKAGPGCPDGALAKIVARDIVAEMKREGKNVRNHFKTLVEAARAFVEK